MANTVKISGVLYKKEACSRTKGGAQAVAQRERNKGRTARVLKNGKMFCVYVGPKRVKGTKKASASKRKTSAKRKTTSTRRRKRTTKKK